MISVNEALSLLSFDALELQKIAKIEATLDDAIAREYSTGKMAGAPIKLEVNDHVEAKLAYAVARSYEAKGNWRVGVLSITPLTLQFIPQILPEILGRGAKNLPPIVRIEASKISATKRLLVRMATRSRPEQALEVLTKYRSMAGIPVTIEVVIDEDDETMMTAPMLQRLHALECVVTVGRHKNKVEACNAGRVSDFDVLLLASDDMVPVKDGYAARVLAAMGEHWPFLDGAIYFDDGHQHANLVTLPVMGRRFYEQCGSFVYHTSYQSLFCDTEQQDLWSLMGRLHYVDEVIIEHRHHVWGKSSNDALYRRNDALYNADKEIFEARSTLRLPDAQWTFGTSPMWLSICIATLPERGASLTLLVDELYRQIERYCDHGEVEIIIDAGGGSIGEKRQRLLERAKAHYVCFADDDDAVSHDYVKRMMRGIHSESPRADCVSLSGVMTTAGGVPERFEHSIKNVEWDFVDGKHIRGVNHLNAVKRDLALQAGFPALDHAEDHAYAMKLAPLLKTEASIGDAPAYLYFFQPAKNKQATP